MAEKRVIKVRNLELGSGRPKICIPVTAANREELAAQVERILDSPCDMVEWRAAFFERAGCETGDTDVAAKDTDGAVKNGDVAAKDTDGAVKTAASSVSWILEPLAFLRERLGEKALLFTFRTKEEGGECSISLDEYRRLNEAAAASGLADLIDVELNRGEELLQGLAAFAHQKGCLVVGSFHDFFGTPSGETLTELLRRMQSLGADVTKAAVMPCTDRDVMTLLDASLAMKEQYADRPYITMSMGARGGISRLCGMLTGSALTFATAGASSAPGQMNAQLVDRVLATLEM